MKKSTTERSLLGVRLTDEMTDAIDAAAARDGVNRTKFVERLFEHAVQPGVAVSVLENIARSLQQEEKTGAADSEWAQYSRGQLHGAKWMLEALLGKGAKNEALVRLRKKIGRIPSVAPLIDGRHLGFDSDAG